MFQIENSFKINQKFRLRTFLSHCFLGWRYESLYSFNRLPSLVDNMSTNNVTVD